MFVRVIDGCITCGVCEGICPEVFTVRNVAEAENMNVPGNEQACRHAAECCPVSVIQIEE